MKILSWLFVAPFALLVAWIGSAVVYETLNTSIHRFRLTVEVETPAGVKSGASVLQSAWTQKAEWVPQTHGTRPALSGEAVFVDLGGGRHVIAILGLGATGSDWGFEQLASRAFGDNTPYWYRKAPSWTGKGDLPRRLIPTLVTFGDLNDPTTARVVEPEAFEREFGPRVRFKRATIEMVSPGWWPLNLVGIGGEPVTRGIEGKLPWVKTIRGYLNGKFACNPSVESCLDVGHFRKG